MRHALLAGALLVLLCSTLAAVATPARPGGAPRAARTPAAPRAPARSPVPARPPGPAPTARPPLGASALYARRARRLVQAYLRLKLLEAREADLDRARKVVERKLGIKALLGETPPPDAW
ncbi:MAG TPA: hypothetical protein VFB22_16155 [Candidatus Baltobacteraceae bacterium]|nr:hypothetical protein [Candidatus Baltobacteraceae bacterium]